MARYTKCFSELIVALEEISALQRLARVQERTDPLRHSKEINAMCRGGIVLLSASLEAYVEALGETALDSVHAKKIDRSRIDPCVLYFASRQMVDEIAEARRDQPSRKAEAVSRFLSADGELWGGNGPLPRPLNVQMFNGSFSNPKFEKIKAYFSRFGYKTLEGDIGSRLRQSFATDKNAINHIVDLRNRIAHGDASATKTPADVELLVATVHRFGRAMDQSFAAWCAKNLCAIR